MSQNTTQEIFEINTLIENINIKLCTRCENGVKQLLALVTSEGDVVLHYTYGELRPVLRRIPWFNEPNKVIQAICFDPSATWLLVVSSDCSLYIIPALNMVDKRQKIDCKWSINDITHFPKHVQVPDSKPTSIVWWQTYDCNQNALVGFENGSIVLVSLTDGRCLGNCSINEPVKLLYLCQDNSLDTVSLLINAVNGQQWRLILEHHSTGYLWPPDINNQVDDSTRSRLHNLKQLGADKLASLRQRLTEARGSRRDSHSSDTASESSHSESTHSMHSGPELLPHLCDTYFAPQYARNRYLFSAFYKPTSLLTIHAVDVESAPLYVHKLPQKTASLLLTDKLIYTVNNDNNMVSIISTQLSECRLEGDAEFNSESLVAQFYIEEGHILQLYKLLDLSSVRLRKNRDDNKKDKLFELPKSVDDLRLQKPRVDTCVIVTNRSVYKINISCSPIAKFVEYVTEENDLEKAEKLSLIFGLNIQQLLESSGDLLISRGSYHSGIILYKQAKVHLLKRVLKLAVTADCKTLLKFVHLCLSASKVDMSIATKIHIGNLAVMAYTELLLRYGGHQRISNTKDFMNFLCYEEYYDQILAVNVACQAGHWNIVALLGKSRGLQMEVVSALSQILQSARAPKPTEKEFVCALSEPSLTQSLLILGQSSQVIFHYIRTNVVVFSLEILRRLAIQLDPSQPCAAPLVNRLFQTVKNSSSIDTTIESVDLENPDRAIVTVKDFIETFLIVAIHLTSKAENTIFDLSLLDAIPRPALVPLSPPIKSLPDLKPLSCGYEHALVVRNGDAYAMGVSASGCLGLGPLLSQSSPPRLVHTLAEIRARVLSVACGKKHSLALTDFGMTEKQLNATKKLVRNTCQNKAKATSEQISAMQKGDFDQGTNAECYLYCIMNTYKLLGKDNSFDWKGGIKALKANAPENIAAPGAQSIEHCKDAVKSSSDKCKASMEIAKCLYDDNPGIYAWGSNTYGQLGLGPHVQESPYPQMLSSISSLKFVEVAAGQYHSIALSSTGKVYTWGWGIHGQLGHGNCDNEFRPKQLNFSHPVKQVAAGHAHSLVLTVEGKLYGFGSNVFGQLESCQLDSNKSIRPVWVLLMPDIYTPIEKVATGYFHNIAIRADQDVYTWGASPQEVRIFQSKNNQKQNGLSLRPLDSWKASVQVYSAQGKPPIEQVAVGYRHSAILHNGKILWGKNKDEDMCPPKLREQDNMNSLFMQRFLHVACGVDYTMAIDHTGKLLAWGSPSMAQTILGRTAEEDNKKLEGKVLLFKNTKRIIKFPNAGQSNANNFPIEVPGLPTMAITFSPNDQKLLFSKHFTPYAVLSIENEPESFEHHSTTQYDHIYECPDLKFGPKTLHYALETYHGFYDTDNVLSKCLEVQDYQAAAKVTMLDGHFGDSLGFQLVAVKRYMDTLELNLNSIYSKRASKDQGVVELNVKNMQDDLNEKNLMYCHSPAHILSSSSSLDSIRQWDDLEHQGGLESPCDVSDIRQNITQYVQSLRNNESPPISSVSKMVSEIDNVQIKMKDTETELQIKDKTTKEVIDAASYLVEFFIKKIYTSENHILMQNILLRCIEFWLANNLPVPVLESILLKNLDKYFYPLSILLFCKNFSNDLDEDILKEGKDRKPTSSDFLKEFSTKFCLQLCSMVLENVNKS